MDRQTDTWPGGQTTRQTDRQTHCHVNGKPDRDRQTEGHTYA